jgi:hypothetical protein
MANNIFDNAVELADRFLSAAVVAINREYADPKDKDWATLVAAHMNAPAIAYQAQIIDTPREE